jgi:hypothetical protein
MPEGWHQPLLDLYSNADHAGEGVDFRAVEGASHEGEGGTQAVGWKNSWVS